MRFSSANSVADVLSPGKSTRKRFCSRATWHFATRIGLGRVLLFLIAFVVFSAKAAESKRVLVVHSFINAAPPFTTHSTAFETELTAKMGGLVDLDEVSLDVARYASLDMEEALVDFMRKRHAKWQPDLVVPVGSPAGIFVAQYRDRLFPKRTPIIYTGMDQRRLPAEALQQNAGFVGESFDMPGLVQDILQLAPATTNIAVVIGASPLERFWADVLRREYAQFTNRIHFDYFSDLSLEQMLERSANLPPNSFILLVLLMRDATGVTHDADEALMRMHAVANAPINSIFRHQLGLGIVGGRLYQAELEGIESARIAVRVLGGEPVTNFPPVVIGPVGPSYDSRELQRWKISEERLPPGSTILFREPTFWERYRWYIVLVVSVFVAQAILITLLMRNLVRRRRAERQLRETEERMMLAADAAALGMFVWNASETEMWASEKLREIHGFRPDERISIQRLMERVHPEDRGAVERTMTEALESRTPFFIQHRLVVPGGGLKWISKSGRVEALVPGSSNGAVRLLGIAVDITERVEAEQAAREVSGKLITAQEDERRRIARDLHDDLNQRLAMLSVEADLLGRIDHSPEAVPFIHEISTQVKDLSTEIHKLSYQLHPAKLEQLGLVAAARSLCNEQGRLWKVPIEFVHADIPRDLNDGTALCVYRIIQEALQNVGKHSTATSARVELRMDGETLHLTLSDNGRGFDPGNVANHAGLGLVGMRERVRLAQGQISVDSKPGEGTVIKVSVPVYGAGRQDRTRSKPGKADKAGTSFSAATDPVI